MRRRTGTILLVILLISGFGLILYPFAWNAITGSAQAHVIEKYEKNVSAMDKKTIAREKEKAEAYDEETVATAGTGTNYGDLLNVGDVMGYLEIPKIRETLPIYHGTEELVLQKGAGHLEGSSLPVGGESTHCVLASHSGLSSARLFTQLNQMKEGDKFFIHVLDELLTYQVDQISVVLPEDKTKLQIEPGKDLVTLLTCTPVGSNTHRLLVRGRRIKSEGKQVTNVEVKKGISGKTGALSGWKKIGIGMTLAGVILFLFLLCMKLAGKLVHI